MDIPRNSAAATHPTAPVAAPPTKSELDVASSREPNRPGLAVERDFALLAADVVLVAGGAWLVGAGIAAGGVTALVAGAGAALALTALALGRGRPSVIAASLVSGVGLVLAAAGVAMVRVVRGDHG